eukprot:2425692-Rhodomonas_salina.2
MCLSWAGGGPSSTLDGPPRPGLASSRRARAVLRGRLWNRCDSIRTNAAPRASRSPVFPIPSVPPSMPFLPPSVRPSPVLPPCPSRSPLLLLQTVERKPLRRTSRNAKFEGSRK